MSQYPEHEKLQAVKDKSQAIGEFVEWLQGTKGFRLAKWEKVPDESVFADEGSEVDELFQQFINIEQLLAEFFGIDLQKLEQEKRAMLEQIRKLNQKPKDEMASVGAGGL